MINLKLSQQLLQKLSPQQIQMIKLIELPTLLFEQRVNQEIEENPVLEREQSEEERDNDSDISVDEYLKEDSTPQYKYKTNNVSKDDPAPSFTVAGGISLTEFLEQQLGFKDLDEKQHSIGEFIIGSLDDDGYLRRDMESLVDDLAFTTGIEATVPEIEKVLHIVQDLEPVGVGARDLKECLLLQIKAVAENSKDVRIARKILESYFDDFSNRRFERIMERMNITEDEFRDASEQILHLSPKPSNMYSESEQTDHLPYITPDFILDYQNGEFELSLNSYNIPDIKINRRYVDMIRGMVSGSGGKVTAENREAVAFIKNKIESAKWFMLAIKQRRDTLMSTMNAILNYQRDYFVDGDQTKLRPMILKDIADRTELDISTISRVVNSKYVQTHFGMLLLKELFSEGLKMQDGEEASSREIKRILTECIDAEDKRSPINDEQLMTILHDKGYNIARRTVAKYREMLGIPVARLRRIL